MHRSHDLVISPILRAIQQNRYQSRSDADAARCESFRNAIRCFRAAAELGLRTAAICSQRYGVFELNA